MEISFFNTSSERNKLVKTLSDGLGLTGTLRESTSIINPVIMVEATSLMYNYCYIPSFNRYYFVDDITSIRNNVWQVSLSIDVLMTYSSGIKNLYAMLERQQASGNSNVLIDDGWICENRIFNQVYQFPSGFGDGDYILLTAGAI